MTPHVAEPPAWDINPDPDSDAQRDRFRTELQAALSNLRDNLDIHLVRAFFMAAMDDIFGDAQ